MKRVALKTFGCRLNQAESADIRSRLIAAGHEIVSLKDPCDAVIIHSCTITAGAEKDSLRLCRSLKAKNASIIVAIIGCAVEANPERFAQRSGADLLLGQKDKYRLSELLFAKRSPQSRNDVPTVPAFETIRSIVKVQDGCDFRCSYCIVPDARGLPRNRNKDDILMEVRALAEQDYKEIVLTGANLACFSTPKYHLVDLISDIEQIPGVSRIRLSSIEISASEKPVIDYMVSSHRLCRYLHLPLQSGDDRILSSMCRRYSATQYRRLVEYALDKMPLLGLGTDILVGFPGEDEVAFNNTISLVQEFPFSNLHVFPYSRRPGTPAASMKAQVDERIKKERVGRIRKMGALKKHSFAKQFIGRQVTALTERIDSNHTGVGWTAEYVEAEIPPRLAEVNTLTTFSPSAARKGRLQGEFDVSKGLIRLPAPAST